MKRITVLALIAINFLAACGHKEVPKEESKEFVLSDTMMNMIQVDTVRMCHIGDEVALSGQVSFNENQVVKVFPANSGQVIESKVSLGDKVTKGQALAVVRSADIAGSYSDLAGANADLAIAQRALDNATSLYKGGISSEREYTEARQNYEKSLAARNKIQNTLHINGGARTSANGQYVLVAPISGYVVEKKVNAGSYIRPDMGDNLFSISDLSKVWVNANVYESDIQRIKEGYPVQVTTLAYPNRIFHGKIDRVSEVLDSNSKALVARISIDNADNVLRPQMFAKIIVTNQEGSEAVCIPTAALISLNGKSYVVVYNGKNDLKNVEVSVIKTVGDKTYINSGLEIGQRIITKNQLLIFNQMVGN